MRALLALALFSSCGSVGEDDFAGARIGAGGAPMFDLGAVTLCQGTTFVGPPDSVAAGICAPAGAQPGPSCVTDASCGSRERCLCGRCSIRFCDGAGQCGAGQDCNFRTGTCGIPCTSAPGCPAGDICDRGFCTSACAVDADCQTGETCGAANHRCSSAACTGAADCVGTQGCSIQRNPGDVREPALVGDPLVLFVELRPAPAGGQILRALPSNGGRDWRFDPAGPVLAPAASEARIGAPAAVRRGGALLLYFEQPGGIGRATSSDDGLTFVRDAAAVLVPDQSWEAGTVGSPGATVLGNGTVLLFYEGGSGAGIGLAVSADGLRFTKPSSEPVLDAANVTDPLLWRQISRVGQPAPERMADPTGRERVGLWFSARGAESPSSFSNGMFLPPVLNDSIGYAVSGDGGRHFTLYPFNPVFDRVENFLQHDQELAPTVVTTGKTRLLLYGAADAQGRATGLGAATGPGP